jgi:hypothetical protein
MPFDMYICFETKNIKFHKTALKTFKTIFEKIWRILLEEKRNDDAEINKEPKISETWKEQTMQNSFTFVSTVVLASAAALLFACEKNILSWNRI